MKLMWLDTDRWTKEDTRRAITFVSAVLVGVGRWVHCFTDVAEVCVLNSDL